MPSVQERLTDAVLATIRTRRDDREVAQSPLLNGSRNHAAIALRAATFSDFEKVALLHKRLGQGADSVENWKRLWVDNPALKNREVTPRIGWILESAGSVVGFFGTIPLLCEFQGTTLTAAASCRFAVDPEFRSSSHLLVSSFLRQKDVDLFLNTTATPAAGKMMEASKASPVPQLDYGTVLFWVLDHRRFSEAVLKKLEARPALAKVGSFAGSVAMWAEARLRRRFPQVSTADSEVSECTLDTLPSDFDAFCTEQAMASKKLIGKRSSEVLRWHFTPPGSQKICRVFTYRSGGRITGYAVSRQERDPQFGLVRCVVADLIAAEDDPKVVQALVAAAHASAKRSGSHVLEVTGFPRTIRRALDEWKPLTRQYPSNPYFYKARDRSLHERLSSEDLWYACPFDGDATLWP